MALGAFGFFALDGVAEKSQLRWQCGHSCTDADVAPVRRDFIAADISLGVAAVALGGALIMLLADRSPPADQRFARTIWK